VGFGGAVCHIYPLEGIDYMSMLYVT
jgi:hypothetical protein